MLAREGGMVEKSAITSYAWKEEYPINWERTTVLAQAMQEAQRATYMLLNEALHPHQQDASYRNHLSHDGGL